MIFTAFLRQTYTLKRIAFSLLLSLIFLSCLSIGGEIQLVPSYGFSAKAKYGYWAPVTVEIRYTPANPERILDAELRVHAWTDEKPQRKLIYTRPFRMGAGRKSLTVLCMPTGIVSPDGRSTLEVSVYDHSLAKELERITLSRSHMMNNSDASMNQDVVLIGVLAEADGSSLPAGWLDETLRKRQAWIRTFYGLGIDGPGVGQTIVSARILPQDAPDQWAGYHALYALLWHAPDPESLRPPQLEALRQWVWQGGRLLITLDSKTKSSDVSFLADLLPCSVGTRHDEVLRQASRDEVDQDGVMQKVAYSRVPEWIEDSMNGQWMYDEILNQASVWWVRNRDSRQELAVFKLSPTTGHRLFDTKADTPTIGVRGNYGTGSVTVLAVDLSAWPLKDHPGVHALAGRALGIPFNPLDTLRLDMGFEGAPLTISQTVEIDKMADRYLSDSPTLEPVPFIWIVLFLSLYAVLVGPFDYFILYRWNSLHRTWGTFTLYVVLFSAAAWGGAYALRGGRTLSRSLTVRDEVVDDKRARIREFFGLYSPQNARFDLDAGANAYPLALGDKRYDTSQRARDPRRPNPVLGGASVFRQGKEHRLEELPVRQWSAKYLFVDRLDNTVTPVLTGDLRFSDGKLSGSFTVTSKQSLNDAYLVCRGGVYPIGQLASGATWPSVTATTREPFVEAMARLSSIRGPESEFSFVQMAPVFQETIAYSDSPWRGEWLAALSLTRLTAIHLRPLIQEEQFIPPRHLLPLARFRTGDKAILPAINTNLYSRQLTRGLSLEQIWHTHAGTDERYLSDLSNVIREGGIVLFARIDRCSETVHVPGWNMEREGFTMVRIVFPPHTESESGRLWNDDLYGRTETSLRGLDGARRAKPID